MNIKKSLPSVAVIELWNINVFILVLLQVAALMEKSPNQIIGVFKVRSYKLNSSRGHTTDFYLGLPTVGQIQGVLPEIFGRGVRPTF